MDLLIKSKLVDSGNVNDINMLRESDDSEGYNQGNNDGNDRVKMDTKESERTFEGETVNTLKHVDNSSCSSIAEAVLVINELPFTTEEKAEYIRTLMAEKVQK